MTEIANYVLVIENYVTTLWCNWTKNAGRWTRLKIRHQVRWAWRQNNGHHVRICNVLNSSAIEPWKCIETRIFVILHGHRRTSFATDKQVLDYNRALSIKVNWFLRRIISIDLTFKTDNYRFDPKRRFLIDQLWVLPLPPGTAKPCLLRKPRCECLHGLFSLSSRGFVRFIYFSMLSLSFSF